MNEKKASQGAVNIGTASLILIFIILSLVTFAVLSLSSAAGEWKLSERNQESVKGYYAADTKGVEFTAYVESVLEKCLEKAKTNEEFLSLAKAELSDYYIEEKQSVGMDVEMPFDQKLQVILQLGKDFPGGYRILTWNVYMAEDYEIDQSLQLWTGE